MNTPSRLPAFAAFVSFAAALTGQQTLLVSPSGPFFEIAAAVAAADAGDTVLVRRGDYSTFTLTAAVAVIAEPGTRIAGGFRVIGVPAGGAVVVHNLDLQFAHASQTGLHLADNAAPVHLDAITYDNGDNNLIQRCALVSLSRCRLAGGGLGGPVGLQVEDSVVHLDGCVVTCTPQLPPGRHRALDCARSTVVVGASELRGGDERPILSGTMQATVAVVLRSGTLQLARGTTVAAGAAASDAVAAIETLGGHLDVDSGVTLTGSNTVAPIIGPATVATVLLPAVRSQGGRVGAALAGEALAPPQGLCIAFLGLPQPPLSTVVGALWAQPPVHVVDFGVVPATGRRPYSVAVPAALPPGLAVTVQAFVDAAGRTALSAPTTAVIGS